MQQRREYSGRLFIFGAGASHFANFPLGDSLFPFLIDHCWASIGALEYLEAYVDLYPNGERDVTDFEKLLTRFELYGAPSITEFADGAPPISQDAFYARRPHLKINASREKIDLNRFYQSRMRRRADNMVFWTHRSLDEISGQIAEAFAAHHACLRHGGKHFAKAIDRQSSAFFVGRCPCTNPSRSAMRNRILGAIGKLFKAGDRIITFNWDCLLESALWNAKKWSFVDGYGIEVKLPDDDFQRCAKRSAHIRRPSQVTLLKAHGSINWARGLYDNALGVDLLGSLFDLPVSRSYAPNEYILNANHSVDEEPLSEEGIVLSPTYMKSYDSPILISVWEQIFNALSTAREITVVGYSLPKEDIAARSIFAIGLLKNKCCRSVKVVLPNINTTDWPAVLDAVGKRIETHSDKFEDWLWAAVD